MKTEAGNGRDVAMLLVTPAPVSGPNVPILVSRGHNDWPAMRVPKRPGRSKFGCSVFPNALPPRSGGPQLDRCSLVHLGTLPQIRLSAWRSLFSILCYFPSSLSSDCQLSVSVSSNTEGSLFKVISVSPNHI